MAKYKFYKVVFKSGEVIKEKVIIDKSPQAIKKKYVDVEVIKITLIKLPSDYREVYKQEILHFLSNCRVKKCKVILYSDVRDKVQLITVISSSLRAIDSMIRLTDWSMYFIAETKKCTYEELCYFFFEQKEKTVITDFS